MLADPYLWLGVLIGVVGLWLFLRYKAQQAE